jgi:hypothetical protein
MEPDRKEVVLGAGTRVLAAVACLVFCTSVLSAAQPPALNPFRRPEAARPEGVSGRVLLSDDRQLTGQVYLTRGARLKIYDAQTERQREVPLSEIQRIQAVVAGEWLEKEWRFRENANNEKVYTGRSYPVREYRHVLTLAGGQKLEGTLSAVLYVQAEGAASPTKLLLHKRHKGDPGNSLEALVYVREVVLEVEGHSAPVDSARPDDAP